VFHDVFGHVPLLALPEFADYMQAYGGGGLRAARLGTIDRLSRLYWYTVEFGLIRGRDGLRIYGSGIASSRSETIFALDDPSPNRIRFDLERVMRTRYRIDDLQRSYFVIDSFEDLRRQTEEPDFAPIYERLSAMSDIEPGAILPQDELFP
jgi:phenylalanine-4-hydroxylase